MFYPLEVKTRPKTLCCAIGRKEVCGGSEVIKGFFSNSDRSHWANLMLTSALPGFLTHWEISEDRGIINELRRAILHCQDDDRLAHPLYLFHAEFWISRHFSLTKLLSAQQFNSTQRWSRKWRTIAEKIAQKGPNKLNVLLKCHGLCLSPQLFAKASFWLTLLAPISRRQHWHLLWGNERVMMIYSVSTHLERSMLLHLVHMLLSCTISNGTVSNDMVWLPCCNSCMWKGSQP